MKDKTPGEDALQIPVDKRKKKKKKRVVDAMPKIDVESLNHELKVTIKQPSAKQITEMKPGWQIQLKR